MGAGFAVRAGECSAVRAGAEEGGTQGRLQVSLLGHRIICCLAESAALLATCIGRQGEMLPACSPARPPARPPGRPRAHLQRQRSAIEVQVTIGGLLQHLDELLGQQGQGGVEARTGCGAQGSVGARGLQTWRAQEGPLWQGHHSLSAAARPPAACASALRELGRLLVRRLRRVASGASPAPPAESLPACTRTRPRPPRALLVISVSGGS